MEQLLSVWTSLETRRKAVVALATVAVLVTVLALARMAAAPNLTLLYSGLEPDAAGEVVAALDARGVTYDVRSGAIYVDARDRDALRMTLAAEGLPANSTKGYELLDTLSGFGTTAQMFDAAYWRAKEGELARTIMSAPHIASARVHIGTPVAQGLRLRNQPTASVTVTTRDGTLSGPHAKALKFLVASAVPGLAPDDVSVIDARGGLIQAGDEETTGTTAADRTAELRQNVERLLEARVGYGNAVVEVSIDTAQEAEVIRERTFDPDGRVAISTETSENANTASENGDPGVTVASNLPTGAAGGVGSSSNSNLSEVRERVNYEVSETTREVTRGPGVIKRVTVAVLVDGIRGVDDTGEPTWVPRSPEELTALRELVANAIGFDEARGDSISIQTMEFEPIAALGTEATAGLLSQLGIDLTALIKSTLLALVALILGLFVIRPSFRAAAASNGSLPAPDLTAEAVTPALTGEIEEGDFDLPDIAVVSDFDFGDGIGGQRALDHVLDPVERLRKLIEERQPETVEILRGWMEDDVGETT
ncbi:flagellar basal-body MS-ring/collar protein FliF [uncultured Maritimibacter sp.]|uniref:flagellar basal-body MS-ring/collar protein FliF n=1 Tax=uncultured Maritimibacter sp. TaxID=991866 RepID=UPI0026395B9C|nr:flagellar basal-body MS-ring/collar protein FliF [uncultured Maritimibacter sp.]